MNKKKKQRELLDQFSKGMEQSCSKDTSTGQGVDVKGHFIGDVREEKEEIKDEIDDRFV